MSACKENYCESIGNKCWNKVADCLTCEIGGVPCLTCKTGLYLADVGVACVEKCPDNECIYTPLTCETSTVEFCAECTGDATICTKC